MNDTPQGDGNMINLSVPNLSMDILEIRMNDTPQGDGNGKI